LRTPVSEAELKLRIARSLQRLGGAGDGEQLVVGDLALDFATHEARVGEHRVELTHMEYELLRFLATHHGESSRARFCSTASGGTASPARPGPSTCTCGGCGRSSGRAPG